MCQFSHAITVNVQKSLFTVGLPDCHRHNVKETLMDFEVLVVIEMSLAACVSEPVYDVILSSSVDP